MTMTPALKGQLTKAVKAGTDVHSQFHNVHSVFHRHMPHEQATHATRKYLRTL